MDSLKATKCLALDMDMEFRSGQTELSTEGIGKITELMARGVSGTQMEIDSKVNLRTTSRMARELIPAKTAPFIKVCGWMMFSMDRVKQSGPMGLVS
jgi:hypothetical protein